MQYAVAFTSLLALATATALPTTLSTITVSAATEVGSAKTHTQLTPLAARNIRTDVFTQMEREWLNKCEYILPLCMCHLSIISERYNRVCDNDFLHNWFPEQLGQCTDVPHEGEFCQGGEKDSGPARTSTAPPAPTPPPMTTITPTVTATAASEVSSTQTSMETAPIATPIAISTSESALEASPASTTSTAIDSTNFSSIKARDLPLGQDLTPFLHAEVEEIRRCEYEKPTCWCIYFEARRIWIRDHCGDMSKTITHKQAACAISEEGPHLKDYCDDGKEQSPPGNTWTLTITAPAVTTTLTKQTVTQTSTK